MKQGWLLALFILCSHHSLAQWKVPFVTKRFEERNNNYEDNYKYYCENDSTLGIKSLRKSLHLFHFRLSCFEYYLDVWTDNMQDYNGQIKAVAYNEQDKRYDRLVMLTPQQAENIYRLLNKSGAFHIPSSEKIKGWEESLDCGGWTIEQATPTCYLYRAYECPVGNVDRLEEGNIILGIMKQLYLEYIGQVWNQFFNSLPNGCYRTAGIIGRCK